MKHKPALLVVFFLMGASVGYAQSLAESVSAPFHFSSRGTAYGVQGEFEGTYLIHAESIEVNVTKATIYVSEHCPYQGRRSINRLKFGLAIETGPEGRWKIETGQSLVLGLVMSPKEEYELSNLHFLIPKESGIDLTKRWFVAEIQTDALDLPDEKIKSGFVYAFSCKDIFVPLDSTRPNE